MKKLFALSLSLPLALFAADEALPKPEAVFNRFIEASGGRTAVEKRHNEVQKGSVEFSAQGIKGTIAVYEAAPDKNRAIIEITGVGKIESGANGEVAWENSILQGPRIKQGQERIEALRDSVFNAVLFWQKLYEKVETVGSETVEGHDCFKLLLTPKDGHSTSEYYDKKTGLLVKTQATRASAMGEVNGEIVYDDYRKDGDMVNPHKLTERFAGQEFQVHVQTAETNVELPAGIFDVPPEVQALLKKAAPPAAKATPAPPPPPGATAGKLTVFMGGRQVASESYTVSKSSGKIEVNGSGNASLGLMQVDIDQFRVLTDDKYRLIEANAKAKMGQIQMNVSTTFADGKAKNQIDSGQGPTLKEDSASTDAVVVNANLPLYPWSLLAMRANLSDQQPQQFPVYVLGQGEVAATVVFKGRESVEFDGGKTAELNHINATGQTPQGQPISLDFWVDDDRKLIKMAVPAQSVEAYQEGYSRKAPPDAPKPAPSPN